MGMNGPNKLCLTFQRPTCATANAFQFLSISISFSNFRGLEQSYNLHIAQLTSQLNERVFFFFLPSKQTVMPF